MSSSLDQSSSFVDETKDKNENEETQVPVFRLKHDMRPLEEQKKSADEEIARIREEITRIDGSLSLAKKTYEDEKTVVCRNNENVDDLYPDFEREPEKYKSVPNLKNLVDLRVQIISLETQKADKQQNLSVATQNREDLNATPYDALQLIKKLKVDQEQTRKEFQELNSTALEVEKGINDVKSQINEYQLKIQKLNETLDEVEKRERDALQNLRKDYKEIDEFLKQYHTNVV